MRVSLVPAQWSEDMTQPNPWGQFTQIFCCVVLLLVLACGSSEALPRRTQQAIQSLCLTASAASIASHAFFWSLKFTLPSSFLMQHLGMFVSSCHFWSLLVATLLSEEGFVGTLFYMKIKWPRKEHLKIQHHFPKDKSPYCDLFGFWTVTSVRIFFGFTFQLLFCRGFQKYSRLY